MWLQKNIPQVDCMMKTRREWGRTPHEQPFTGIGAFTLRENIYCPLTWSPHHFIWEDKHANQGLYPISSSGDTFLESGQEGLKNLIKVWWFFHCVVYSSETQTPSWHWGCAQDSCLKQNLLNLSLSHSLHFSLLHIPSNTPAPRYPVMILDDISQPW